MCSIKLLPSDKDPFFFSVGINIVFFTKETENKSAKHYRFFSNQLVVEMISYSYRVFDDSNIKTRQKLVTNSALVISPGAMKTAVGDWSEGSWLSMYSRLSQTRPPHFLQVANIFLGLTSLPKFKSATYLLPIHYYKSYISLQGLRSSFIENFLISMYGFFYLVFNKIAA